MFADCSSPHAAHTHAHSIFTRPKQFLLQFQQPLETGRAILNDTAKAYQRNTYYGTGYLIGSWLYTPISPFVLGKGNQMLQSLSNFVSCAFCDDDVDHEEEEGVGATVAGPRPPP